MEHDDLSRVLRQQEALAIFGGYAFDEPDLYKVLQAATLVCATQLDVPLCKVSRYDAVADTLTVIAGVGWQDGVIGYIEPQGLSPARTAVMTKKPVIITTMTAVDNADPVYALYKNHGIVSCVNVVIRRVASNPPFGVLEIDSPVQHFYDEQDIRFLTGFANVLAERASTVDTIQMLRRAVTEKDAALRAQERVLSELHHRVRNNLQLVIGMLRDLPIDTEIVGLRIFSLAQVYDHLISAQAQHHIDFGSYLESLCATLAPLFEEHSLRLVCRATNVFVGLDIASALALAANELLLVRLERMIQNTTVTVELTGVGTLFHLKVSDDDPKEVLNVGNRRSGIGLLQRLAKQLQAELVIDTQNGLTTTLIFSPIRDNPPITQV